MQIQTQADCNKWTNWKAPSDCCRFLFYSHFLFASNRLSSTNAGYDFHYSNPYYTALTTFQLRVDSSSSRSLLKLVLSCSCFFAHEKRTTKHSMRVKQLLIINLFDLIIHKYVSTINNTPQPFPAARAHWFPWYCTCDCIFCKIYTFTLSYSLCIAQ